MRLVGHGFRQKASRSILIMVLLLALQMSGAGCALFQSPHQPAMLETKKLELYVDRVFNQGLMLQVDVAFFTINQNPKEITSVGVKAWFLENKRTQWPYRQSLSLSPGRHRKEVLQLKMPADCQGFVVLANYIDLDSDERQVQVFSASQNETEMIFVTNKGLYR